ncbi:MAG: DNA polymerase II [Deltaproteobacteria bacterium]|nr:DNA polymerase II [Deltaproteobacteria bacterium]
MHAASGFIVQAWEEGRAASRSGRTGRLLLTGRLEDGRSFAALVRAPPAALFVARADAQRACALDPALLKLDAQTWTDLPGNELARLEVSAQALGEAEALLERAGVPILARDRPRAEETLTTLGLRGPVSIAGEAQRGRRVDLVFVEPTLTPLANQAKLKWLALDLETDRGGAVIAASLAGAGAGGAGEVLFVGPRLESPLVTSFPNEAELLAALARRIVARDPDVITGWNVIDFDLRVLAARFAACGVPFDIGRTDEVAQRIERPNGRTILNVPGRAVLDAMRLVRASGERFEDLSLEAVSKSVLGEGKSVTSRGLSKLEELERLRREDPDAFCAYCLRDSELVLRILGKTGLDALTARRAALTGVSLELAWTSIPAFERVYGSELRARRVLPPPKEQRRVSGAAGGTVLDAAPGFFRNVWVFDFRSLYPSIMRTFNIDPLAHERALARERADDLVAPNGARFERAPGVLPAIITRYAQEREAAIASGDEIAAFVYKILQNSFYGVLGSDGCRYARTELAGAITSFGKHFLTSARDFFEQRGLRVLYGDTDSVFVQSDHAGDAPMAQLVAAGSESAWEVNALLAQRIREQHQVESHLRIRCEKIYRRFFIPRLKADPSGEGRGRAKGYAGLKLADDGTSSVEIRGMEAVRSDFTPLARRFQVDLLTLAFRGAGLDELRAFCVELAAQVRAGELDQELVYRKSLRRPAEEYASETPQVRAARLLGWRGKQGRVSYVITVAGAEPVDARSGARLDHEHAIETQLMPIARAVADGLGVDGSEWFGPRAQLEFSF